MTLDQWQADISPRLQLIEAGSRTAARNAQMLPGRPEWETLAEDQLATARKALERALANVVAAQEAYRAKPIVESRHAA